jgi:hypothetical protein
LDAGHPDAFPHDVTSADARASDAGKKDAPDSDVGAGDARGDDDDGPPPDDAAPTGPQPIYTGLISPLGITVHDADLCWVAGDTPRGVFCAPKGGGAASAIKRLDRPDDPFLVGAFDVVVDDTYVYWSNGSHNQVVRLKLSGGSAEEYFTGTGRISFLAIQGSKIFASDCPESGSQPKGNIVVGPASGKMSTLIFPSEPTASGVGVSSNSVYWGTNNPNALAFGLQTGNVPVTRVPMAGSVAGLAVDTQGVAYVLVSAQTIYRLDVGSISPVKIYDAGAPFGLSDLAVDDSFVYWSEHDANRIMRMPK